LAERETSSTSSICKSRNKQKKLQSCSFTCGGGGGPLKMTR
jgi:hypothetical protein